MATRINLQNEAGEDVFGDGVATQFKGRVPQNFGKGSLVISTFNTGGVQLLALDDAEGNLIGSVDPTGDNTLNFISRQFTVTFRDPPRGGEAIILNFTPIEEVIDRIDFTVLSFEGLVALLQERVRLRETWTDIFLSNEGQTFIDLIAFAQAGANYMILRRAQESYIKTARLRSSIIRLANLLSFRIRRRVGAITTLEFILPNPLPNQVFIDRFTKVTTSDGLPFLTREAAVIPVGETSVQVEAVQGEFVQEDFVLPPVVPPSFKLLIGDDTIEDSFLEVRIGRRDGGSITLQLWEEVETFINSRNDSRHYQVEFNLDNTVSLRFGDGIFGALPPFMDGPGDGLVRIQFIRTRGEDGNVPSIGFINAPHHQLLP